MRHSPGLWLNGDLAKGDRPAAAPISAARLGAGAALLVLACALPTAAAALSVELASTQVGGFYADGGHDSLAGFQNYFVGYGTSPGSARTAERRAFLCST